MEMTFTLGLFAGALTMFIGASIFLVKFSISVYDGVTMHTTKIRESLQIAARLMEDPEGTKAINEALAQVTRLEHKDEA